MPGGIRFMRGVDCPACGATPSHRKWKPREMDDYRRMQPGRRRPLPPVRGGLDRQMATGTEETAGRLRTEADYRRDCNGDATVFNMSNCHFTESVKTFRN